MEKQKPSERRELAKSLLVVLVIVVIVLVLGVVSFLDQVAQTPFH